MTWKASSSVISNAVRDLSEDVSPRNSRFVQSFLFLLAHEARVKDIFGFCRLGFWFSRQQFCNNRLHSLPRNVRDRLDISAGLTVSCFENIRILDARILLDRADTGRLVGFEKQDPFAVAANEPAGHLFVGFDE